MQGECSNQTAIRYLQITAKGWDNPEVTWEQVDCSKGDFGDWDKDCQCPKAESEPASEPESEPESEPSG